jgi:CHRD domain-containing protein
MTRRLKLLFFFVLLFAAVFQTRCGGGGGGGSAPAPPAGTVVSKTAVMSGGEEVPAVVTGAAGSGRLGVNDTTGAASGSLTIATAPTSTVISVQVQEGARGANGSIVIVLENSGAGVWSVPAGKALSPAQMNTFSAGGLYFNVRTAEHPIGEIRGQIDGQ